MKILQINKFFFQKGGSERYYFALRELLQNHGHKVIDFSMQHPDNLPSPDAEFFSSQIDYSEKQKKLRMALKFISNNEAAKKLEQLVRLEKPDVAHLHNIHHQLTPAITKTLKKFEIPIVQTVHDYQPICPNYLLYTNGAVCTRCKKHKYYACLLHKCVQHSYMKSALAMLEMSYNRCLDNYLQYVDALIAPSKFMFNTLREWGIKNKLYQIYNFVEPPIPTKVYLADYFLYFGRLSKEKGLMTLFSAFKQLPGKKLIVAGDGPLSKELNKIKSPNIKLVGYKEAAELSALIQQAQAVIVPSEWCENNPYSVLETKALKKWIIAANIGGLPELINPRKNGTLFTPGSTEELKKIIENYKYQAGQELENQYTSKFHYKKIMHVYKTVCLEQK